MHENKTLPDQTCPGCARGCPLYAPGCGRGMAYAARLAAGAPPAPEQPGTPRSRPQG